MKYRVWELWNEFGQNGLRTPMDIFVKCMEKFLKDFLVMGDIRKDPKEVNRRAPEWWRNL